MKKLSFVVFILSCVLTGCSKNMTPNSIQYKKIEEKLSFNVVDESKSEEKVNSFISTIKKKREKGNVKFSIIYKIEKSSFIDSVTRSVKSYGYNYKKITKTISESDSPYDMILIATYYDIVDSNCGELKLLNASSYQFGCFSEFNRTISLLNQK